MSANPRGRLRSRLLLALVVILLGATACRFATREEDPRVAARSDLMAALDGAADGDIVELVEAFVAHDFPVTDRVWALTVGLEHALEASNLEASSRLLSQLDAALAELDTVRLAARDESLRVSAEVVVRGAHETAFGRWTGSGNDVARALMDLSVAVYQRHFEDSPHYAAFLWDRAEFLRRSGRRMEAIPIYETILTVDYSGTFRQRAYTSIIDIWSAESQATPLPSDVAQPMPIPSPHAEWIAIAQRRIAEAPAAEDSRKYLLRIARIQLAYHQIAEGYDTLRRIIAAADDAASIEAASLLLNHFAASNPSKRQFRELRKELQANNHLWSDGGFRRQVKALSEKIEGK